ncbi:hypothetical protein K438DRAFT_536445 [Mycena galopus ATCC 62051]|nr:hypothetical protein K438DRAFT_536445 [Mycena galopus ATCC 62051]
MAAFHFFFDISSIVVIQGLVIAGHSLDLQLSPYCFSFTALSVCHQSPHWTFAAHPPLLPAYCAHLCTSVVPHSVTALTSIWHLIRITLTPIWHLIRLKPLIWTSSALLECLPQPHLLCWFLGCSSTSTSSETAVALLCTCPLPNTLCCFLGNLI